MPSRQEEDEKIKQRELAARNRATHVPNLSSRINVTSSVQEPGRLSDSNGTGSTYGGAPSTAGGGQGVSPRKMTRQEEEAMIKQRERQARQASTRVPNLASLVNDTPSTSSGGLPRKPGALSVTPEVVRSAGAAKPSMSPPRVMMTQEEKDSQIKQRERAARGMSTSQVVPNLASRMSPTRNGRPVVNMGEIPAGPPMVPTAPSTQPRRSRQSASRVSVSQVVPNLANKLSPVGPPRDTVQPSGIRPAPMLNQPTTPQRMTQQDQDLLMKQREKQARQTSTRVPNLASFVNDSGAPAAPRTGAQAVAPRSITPPPSKNVTQHERDMLLKQREAAGRRISTSQVVPNLANKLSPKRDGGRPTTMQPGAVSVAPAAPALQPKQTQFGELSQEEQDALIKERESAGRRVSTSQVVPNLANRLSPVGSSNRPKVQPPRVGAMPSAPPVVRQPQPPKPKKMSQDEQDSLIKQREMAAKGMSSSQVVPNLSRMVTSQAAPTGPPQRKITKEVEDSSSLQARYHAAGLALGIENGEELMMQGDLYGAHHMQREPSLQKQQVQPIVESEETIRARYRAAAIAMGGGTQEDEDQQIKAREKAAAEMAMMPAPIPVRSSPRSSQSSSTAMTDADAMAREKARLVDPGPNTGASPRMRSSIRSSVSSDDARAKARGRSNRSSLVQEDNSDVVSGEADPAAAAQQVVTPGAFACNMGEREQLRKSVLPVHPGMELTAGQDDEDEIANSTTDYDPTLDQRISGTSDDATDPVLNQIDEEAPREAVDANQAQNENVETFREESKKDEEKPPNRTWIWIAAVILILAIGGGVGGALAAKGSKPEPLPPPEEITDAPTVAPTIPEIPGLAEARSLLSGVVSSAASLADRTSPQSRALAWLVGEDTILSSIPEGGNILEGQSKFLVRYVLAVFYFSLGGPDWNGSSGWLDKNTDECGWQRISCTLEGSVQSIIEETNSNFAGIIPSELQHLESLDVLFIINNRISGLAGPLRRSMRLLGLQRNQIEGTFPEGIYEMTALTALDLSNNRLSGTLSSNLGNLKQLREFYVRDNDMTGTITDELQGLESLEELSLTLNKFEGDINQIVEGITTLRRLEATDNRFSGSVQSGILQLTNLQRYEVGINRLSASIPEFMGDLSGLLALDLSANDITGTIPTEIGLLTGLQMLNFRQCSLQGAIPSELGQLGALLLLNLEANILEEQFPTELGALEKLNTLSLQHNFLSGPIPTELGKLGRLALLLLENNLLTGTVPTELGLLESLEDLRLSDNNDLSGAIPSEICSLPELNRIAFGRTQLSCDCGAICDDV